MTLQWIVVTRTPSGYPTLSLGPFKTAEAAREFMRSDIQMRELKLNDWVLVPFIPINEG